MGNLSKVKNENYVQIQGWMVNELKLKGRRSCLFDAMNSKNISEMNQAFTITKGRKINHLLEVLHI